MAHRTGAYLRQVGTGLRGRPAAKLAVREGWGKGSSAEEAHASQGP